MPPSRILLDPGNEITHDVRVVTAATSLGLPDQGGVLLWNIRRVLTKIKKVIRYENAVITGVLDKTLCVFVGEGKGLFPSASLVAEVDVVATSSLPCAGVRFLSCEPWIVVVVVEIKHLRDPHGKDQPSARAGRTVPKQPIVLFKADPLMVRGTRGKRYSSRRTGLGQIPCRP